MSKKLHLLVAALGLFVASNVNAQGVTLSQTNGAVSSTTLRCTTQNANGEPTGMAQNHYYRAYTIPAGMSQITEVEIGAYVVDFTSNLQGCPIIVKLYESSGAFPASYPSGLTLLATENVSLSKTARQPNNDPIPEIKKVPLTNPVAVATGDVIVVEIEIQTIAGALFYIGTVDNTSGSETAPAYMMLPSCGTIQMTRPDTMTNVGTQAGSPNLNGKIIINLVEGTLSTEDFFQQHFSMYPNPVTDVLNITSVNGLNANEIRVIDLTGKVVKVQNNASSINVSDLATGTYLIDIMTNEGKATSKFIKK